MKRDCELSTRESIQAFYSDGGILLIRAQGELPTPCYEVDIDRNLLPVEPPEFLLKRCPTAPVCIQVVTPFDYAEIFHVGERPKEVIVHHAEGKDRVPVEDLSEGNVPLAVEVARRPRT